MGKKHRAKQEMLKTPAEDAAGVSEPEPLPEPETKDAPEPSINAEGVEYAAPEPPAEKDIEQEFTEHVRESIGVCKACSKIPGMHKKRTIHMCPHCGMIAKETEETTEEM